MQLQLLQAAKDELQTVGYTATLARAKPLSNQQAGYTMRIRRSTLHDASDLHGPVTKLAESGAALLERRRRAIGRAASALRASAAKWAAAKLESRATPR